MEQRRGSQGGVVKQIQAQLVYNPNVKWILCSKEGKGSGGTLKGET